MRLELTADEAVLHSLVGNETFLRGRAYARGGAVLDPKWRDDTEHVFGQVRGTARAPYTAIAVVEKRPDGVLSSFRGSCTCPVGLNCKHSVALALVALPKHPDLTKPDTALRLVPAVPAVPLVPLVPLVPPVPVTEAAPAPWERSLQGLVRCTPLERPAPAIALQFELATPAQAGRRRDATRLGLRPVVPGKNGGWVRSGINWSSLAYLGYSGRGMAAEHLRLLTEILAMDSAHSAYYSAGPVIYLESFASKRIWALLAEAAALGLPLVHAGKSALPVTIHREPAEFTLDVSRSSRGLDLRARLEVGDARPTPGAALLIGEPAHGVAWWQADGDDTPRLRDRLQLAPFATPIAPALRQIFDTNALHIPQRDEARFFDGYYASLRQQVRIQSTDATVVLPEAEPPVLTLVVRHLEGHRLTLGWHWHYAVGTAARQETLWPQEGAVGRDLVHETAALAVVTRIAASMAQLHETTHEGERLAPAVTLAGIDAIRFTTDVLPRLDELVESAGLVIESIGEATPYREAESAPVVAIAGAEAVDDRDWFDLAFTVSVDGEPVAFEQLFVALSEGISHLILPSGTYFALDCAEFRVLLELITEARALQDRGTETVRLNRYQASLWGELDRLGVVTGQAADWQRVVRELRNATDLAERPAPRSLRADLRPYQLSGFNWLAFLYANRLGGVLADDMGLGKTLQTLAMICDAREREDAGGPFLVVAPTSVVANWASECARFAPDLDVRVIAETRKRRGLELADSVAGADVVITSYTLFRLEYDAYAALPWDGLILDEAQFVKNHQARGYQCAKKLPARFKLAITGTPMENNLMELWSLLSITAPGLFASPSKFEQHYRIPIERNEDTGAARLAQLRRRVKPLMLRRTKDQVARDLPDKQEQIMELELNPKHRRIYQTHLQRERQKVLGLLGDLEKNRFEIFRSLTLLRQASLDVALIDPSYAGVASTKLDALMELLAEIGTDGHRTLVFSQFTRFLDAARRRLDAEGIEYCYLDGSTRNRAAVLADFKSGSAPVFLISLKAGGFGLNLTEADYCILLDPWWNPATEAQAVDRVHRIGQTKKVMVYRLVAKDTIEEKVMALKAAKAKLVGSVMDGGDFSSGALTASDIRGMLE